MHHLTCSTFDHSSLWIIPEIIHPTSQEKLFRFEEMWLAKKGCSDIVKAEWDKHRIDNIAASIVQKIERCGSALRRWSSKNFGSIRKELQQK